MVLSQTSRYALRALILLAQTGDRPILARRLAEELQLPQNYLAKILNQLAHRGLLRSFRGARGGFQLARPPDQIRLIDIVEGFEDLPRSSACLLGLPECSDDADCSIHQRWKPVITSYRRFLEQTTLDDASFGRSPSPVE
ncbi:MAG: Rrf2 family transcriptional regulator [Candidatus Eisenbacteria bacterium]|nr:Rrf2 family transcriptional regulator [Candidatus Eisenbacteria bacterium]